MDRDHVFHFYRIDRGKERRHFSLSDCGQHAQLFIPQHSVCVSVKAYDHRFSIRVQDIQDQAFARRHPRFIRGKVRFCFFLTIFFIRRLFGIVFFARVCHFRSFRQFRIPVTLRCFNGFDEFSCRVFALDILNFIRHFFQCGHICQQFAAAGTSVDYCKLELSGFFASICRGRCDGHRTGLIHFHHTVLINRCDLWCTALPCHFLCRILRENFSLQLCSLIIQPDLCRSGDRYTCGGIFHRHLMRRTDGRTIRRADFDVRTSRAHARHNTGAADFRD